MNTDIEKAIQVIENKITKLEQAKQTLLELFGDNVSRNLTVAPTAMTNNPRKLLRRGNATVGGRISLVSRKQTIIKLLSEKGPMSRKEIFDNSDMPMGSVAFTLNDKTKFYSKDGKWHLVGDENQVVPSTAIQDKLV